MSSFYGFIMRHHVPDHDAQIFAIPLEMTFVPRDEDGDLKLEQDAGGIDPDTQILMDGVAYDFTLDLTATLPKGNKHGAKNVPDSLEGEQVAVITISDFPYPGLDFQMMFLPDANPSYEEMAEFGRGKFKLKDVDTSPGNVPVCFVAGTLIETPAGPVPVESLKAGDAVMLADGRSKRLLMVAHSHFTQAQMMRDAARQPVCLPAGSLGPSRPSQDLWVSRMHRMALHGWEVEMLSSHESAFACAAHVAPTQEAGATRWSDGVHYVHLLMDRHEVLVANGAEAESLFLGEQAMRSLGPEARAEVEVLFDRRPALKTAFKSTALPELKAHEARTWAKMAAGQPVFRDLVTPQAA